MSRSRNAYSVFKVLKKETKKPIRFRIFIEKAHPWYISIYSLPKEERSNTEILEFEGFLKTVDGFYS